MLKKRCEVCGVRFFTKNKTCSIKCGQVIQRRTCDEWWKKNKANFSKMLRELKAKKISTK